MGGTTASKVVPDCLVRDFLLNNVLGDITMKKITVSDVTLKAVQEQEISLTFREKLAIAEKLCAAHVDAIELPILINSKENEVIYRTIAQTVKDAVVKIPVGDNLQGVEHAAQCSKSANKACLQVVMPVSTAQMEYFYHLKAPAMLAKIGELVKAAKEANDCVEFVALDAFRAEQGFVEQCAKVAFENGACCMTVSDDAGEAFPEQYAAMVKSIKAVCDIKVSVQPSNSLSMAAACALEAIKAGADGVKTSVVGNYLSMEVVSDIFRAKKYTLDAECDVDLTNVKSIVSVINGTVQTEVENTNEKAVGTVGASATMTDVCNVVKELGYELSDSDAGKVYEEFKKVVAKKESIDTKELEAIVASTAMQVPSTYHLVNYVVNSGNIIPATANVTLEKDGEKFTGVSTGDGPIDAAFHAIEQVIGHHYELDDFQVHAVTKGRGAVGSSIIRLRADGKLYPGNGVSTDIVGACIRAYINALNKIVYEGK